MNNQTKTLRSSKVVTSSGSIMVGCLHQKNVDFTVPRAQGCTGNYMQLLVSIPLQNCWAPKCWARNCEKNMKKLQVKKNETTITCLTFLFAPYVQITKKNSTMKNEVLSSDKTYDNCEMSLSLDLLVWSYFYEKMQKLCSTNFPYNPSWFIMWNTTLKLL